MSDAPARATVKVPGPDGGMTGWPPAPEPEPEPGLVFVLGLALAFGSVLAPAFEPGPGAEAEAGGSLTEPADPDAAAAVDRSSPPVHSGAAATATQITAVGTRTATSSLIRLRR
ncbi:hypothetical protein EES39_14940 [Streptomyces sp. ADI92-24]|nr:hypothetical protein EES39_14940 [Streptomyces sp. ADI92-24]